MKQRPQSLCNMCGRCCRLATTPVPYDELLKLVEEGEQGAIDFLSIFEPYPSIEAAREQDPTAVDNIIHELKEFGKYEEDKTTFYRCKYISDDNLCGNYENRPELCHRFPSSPYAVVPPGCGFEGWLFWMQEEDKQKVRRSKEQLIELQLLRKKTSDEELINKISAVEEKVQRTIDNYKKYGADFW